VIYAWLFHITLHRDGGNMSSEERIKKALEIAVEYGGVEDTHHKDWVIDQMVRALTGCPILQREVIDNGGIRRNCKVQGESEEYVELVKRACDGEDGSDTYNWPTGIAPELQY
jgi:hypothetical protein